MDNIMNDLQASKSNKKMQYYHITHCVAEIRNISRTVHWIFIWLYPRNDLLHYQVCFLLNNYGIFEKDLYTL